MRSTYIKIEIQAKTSFIDLIDHMKIEIKSNIKQKFIDMKRVTKEKYSTK